MKVEIGKFYNGSLKVIVRFESNSNFWKEDLTWVPTEDEIKLIALTYLGIDTLNDFLKRCRKDDRLCR